ncbi:MAG: DUF4064 domain-containing protein [Clostridium sp.]|nr:DUF4064 domain-containing protein [Clostridium sp.]
MRIAALILGILGGIIGMGGGFFAALFGGLGQAFQAEGATMVTGLGLAAIPAGILGLVGGALAIARPKLAGLLMLISAVVGVILVSAAYIVASIFLVIGGIFAFIGNKELARK